MADWRNYLEGEYDGKNIEEQESQVIEDVFTAEEIAAEIQKKYQEFMEQEEKKKYLIDGAVLVCNKATLDNFELMDGTEIPLAGLKYKTQQDRDERQETVLHVRRDYSNMSVGISRNATVLDCKKGELSELDAKKKETGEVSFKANVYPFRCNCMEKADRVEEQEIIKAHLGECKTNGVCQYLMRLNDKWENWPGEVGKFHEKRAVRVLEETEDGEEKVAFVNADCITMTSVLFCKHGGLITPVWSGQVEDMEVGVPKENVWGVWRISRAGLRALMEIEIVNTTGKKEGYLVMEGNKIIKIKPQDAKDGTITVGFGDSLQEGDLEFYHENGITDLTSDNIKDFEEIKNVEIPVEICFEKLLEDTDSDCHSLLKQFGNHFLTQNQLDALIIARYNCGQLGDKVKVAVFDGAEREELTKYFFEAHKENKKLLSRIEQEMNIYFDGNYKIEQGLHDVIVEPLNNY